MTTAAPDRVRWVDIAKAIAIILVALYHSGLFLTAADVVDDVWLSINKVFQVFRMPLFFFASGLFALSVIRRPWFALWRTRLALLAWTFLLWTAIRFMFFHIVDSPLPLDETKVIRFAIAPIWPQTGLWFLHALVVFFIVAKILDRLRIPGWVQLTGATLVSIPFFAGLTVGNISYNGMLQYFVFFLFACHFRTTVVAAVERRGVIAAISATVILVIGYAAIVKADVQSIPGPMFLLAIVALAAGLLMARSIARVDLLARPAQWMGRQTLPIYVAHVLFIAAFTQVLDPISQSTSIRAVAPVLPVIVTAVAVVASLVLWRLVRDLPVLRCLYEAPPAVRNLEVRRTRQPTESVAR